MAKRSDLGTAARCGLATVLLACSVGACVQDPYAAPGQNAGSSQTAAVRGAVRVIVQFKRPLESLAAQDAIWLKRLQSQTHAQPTYIAAVGSDTHVYSFQPAATQSHAQLLDLLNAMPELVQAEIDQRAKALQH